MYFKVKWEDADQLHFIHSIYFTENQITVIKNGAKVSRKYKGNGNKTSNQRVCSNDSYLLIVFSNENLLIRIKMQVFNVTYERRGTFKTLRR